MYVGKNCSCNESNECNTHPIHCRFVLYFIGIVNYVAFVIYMYTQKKEIHNSRISSKTCVCAT